MELKFSKTNDVCYYEELDNGLKICLYPKLDQTKFHALLGVKYGSNDTMFMSDGEMFKSSLGVAHFLEHKNFEMEDKIDPFDFFNKLGINANASTSFYTTRYYIWGNNNSDTAIDYLIKYVNSPYFTDSNVLKEQGIIGEEIKMYEDDPMWFIDDAARQLIFNKLPIRENIAGTIDSISKITKEELYRCFNEFYKPSNMYLVIVGNFDINKIREMIINNKYLDKEYKTLPKRVTYNEEDYVNSEFKELKMNLVIPKTKYVFKINRELFSIKDYLKLDMYLNMIFNIIFGSTSLLYEKIRKENIANYYYVDHNYYDKFYTLEFDAESDKADIIKEEIDNIIDNIVIEEKDFNRLKKVWIASEIMMSDNVSNIANNIFDDLILYNRVVNDRIDIINSLNMEELNKVIKEINFDNRCFILANPKEY